MSIIQGCDLSHWNADSQFNNLMANDIFFFMLKATEGVTYVDKQFARRAKQVQAKGLGLGAYHFARPDNNLTGAVREAENFIKAVEPFGNECVYALDWEGAAESYSTAWIVEWCDKVEEELGRTPMLYVNHAYAVKADGYLSKYPLWCAKWGEEPKGGIGQWSEYTIWQYTNSPYDKDLFVGTIADFKKIGLSDEGGREEIGHYCGCCCCKK